ncbi:PelD GGDEF domain-containing protein [Rhodoferax sp.]|uniref:PelD GGDEF domain-containing protein n=1 Tax=Rhodoferax sp. TaxID=50421 RepID=UPI0027447F43|nr:PelD GGDEF domain-containing protein [Rhodoferax sp.]
MPRFTLTRFFKRLFAPEAIAPEQAAARTQWLEVAIIPLAAIGLAWLARPNDPMVADGLFPWLWFAPVLIALRYGVLPGLLGSLPVLGNWLLANHLGLVADQFSPEYFFGGGLLVLVCGEFSDVWRDRNLRMEETYLYVTERLSRLTKRHLLLNLSHDRLEQEMLARPGSLRDALARLRSITIERSENLVVMPGAMGLLELLSQYVNIESAVLYTLEPQGLSFVLGEQVAVLGEPETLAPDDELLRLALESNSLAHIASRDLSLERQTRQLVVAPLVAGNNTLIGVLAVTRMPFFSLNVENLQMMSVILAYYADNIRHAPEVRQIQQRLPTLPALFAEELVRMILMQKKVGIASHIVVMTFGGSQREEIRAEYLRVKRGLDLYWQTHVNGMPVIAVLMPFASPSAKEGYLQRIESWLIGRFGGNFESLHIYLRAIDFAREDPLDALTELIKG